MSVDFATNREKLEEIQRVVSKMMGYIPPGDSMNFDTDPWNDLLLIDSICDVPLFAAEDEETAWDE